MTMMDLHESTETTYNTMIRRRRLEKTVDANDQNWFLAICRAQQLSSLTVFNL